MCKHYLMSHVLHNASLLAMCIDHTYYSFLNYGDGLQWKQCTGKRLHCNVVSVLRKPRICANLGLPSANPEFQVCRANLESSDVRRRLPKASTLQAMFWLNSSLFNYSNTTGVYKSTQDPTILKAKGYWLEHRPTSKVLWRSQVRVYAYICC